MRADTLTRMLTCKNLLLLIIAMSGLLSSCVTSLYPLSDDSKDVVYRPELAGTWKQSDGNSYIIADGGADSTYAFTMVEVRTHDDVSVNDTSYFTGRLVQSDGYLFLDCVVDLELHGEYQRLGDYTRAGLAPTHFLFHISIGSGGSTVELAQLQAEPFEKVLKERYPRIRYKMEAESLLLVEPPPALTKLMVQLIKDKADVWEVSTWIKE
ncbi:MAG TPA: hypothetical protein VGE66_03895 [Chitinophagaceae bacterium]